jgi:hypothetical protein
MRESVMKAAPGFGRSGMRSETLLALAGALLLVTPLALAFGSDRPGTPADVRARALGPTTIEVRFTNTARRDELVRYELELQANGVRASPAEEAARSAGMHRSGTGDGWSQFGGTTLRDLIPETEYCFRFWSRLVDGDVRSELPSAWACARTPPYPPLAPLDFRVEWPVPGATAPRLSWSTPDQSSHRGISRFLIDRQSPPGPDRPWIFERAVPGPAGEQSASTRLAFSVDGARIDPNIKHVYRLCAENDGGRTCAKPLEAPAPAKLVGTAAGLSQRTQQTEMAPPPAASARATSSATAVRSRGRGTTSVQAPQAPPAAANAKPAGSARDPSGPVQLNPQPLPPRTLDQLGTEDRKAAIAAARATQILTARQPVLAKPAPGNRTANVQMSLAELRCRGGFALENFQKPAERQKAGTSKAVLALHFQRSGKDRRGVGSHGFGTHLDPGTCVLVDRAWRADDPAGVIFDTDLRASAESDVKRALHGSAPAAPSAEQQPDERSIPEYLTRPDHYWRFFVTGRQGYFFASRHERWVPGEHTQITQAAGLAERAGSSDFGIAKLTSVKVVPSIGGVSFRFIARANAQPVIELGTEPPLRGRDGLQVLRDPIGLQASRDATGSSSTVNWYTGGTAGQGIKLPEEQSYHYIVTVPGDGTVPVQQASGSFKTLREPMTLTVTFKSVHVIDDSDELSDGEGAFTYCVGSASEVQEMPAFATNTQVVANRVLVDDKWRDGPLEIAVQGIDDDALGILLRGRCSLQGPVTNDTADQNVARFRIDTNSPSLAGRRASRSYEMQSPHGKLAFSVSFKIDISRPTRPE